MVILIVKRSKQISGQMSSKLSLKPAGLVLHNNEKLIKNEIIKC